MLDLRLIPPDISREQLATIAQTLSINQGDDLKVLRETCFERSFFACQIGEWNLINPITNELSFLVDHIGRTLLMKAAIQQKDSIVNGLIGRSVALTTTDRLGKTILHYLAEYAAGDSSDRYIELIKKQLLVQYSERTLTSLFIEQISLRKHFISEQLYLQEIDSSRFALSKKIVILKEKINQHRLKFEYLHPGILNDMGFLQRLQSLAGSSEAVETERECQEHLRILYGACASDLENFSEQEIIRQAQQGRDDEVDRFLETCALRFAVKPHETPRVMPLLYNLAGNAFKSAKYERAIYIINILFQIPQAIQEVETGFFASLNSMAGMCCFRLPQNREYKKSEDFFNKAIDLYKQLPREYDEQLLASYYHRATLYMSVNQLKQAEADWRDTLLLAERNIDQNTILFCKVLSNLTFVLLRDKKYEEALFHGERSLSLCPENEVDVYSFILGNLSKAYSSLNRNEEALMKAAINVELLEKSTNRLDYSLASACLDLGNIHLILENNEQALLSYQKAYMNSEIGSESRAIIAAAIGKANLKLGDFNQAAHWSKEASEVFDVLQRNLSNDDWKVTIFQRMVGAYCQWELALLGAEKLDEALVISDMRRARTLVQTLSKRIFPRESISTILTPQRMFALAQELNTTFVVYSALEGKGRCWVICPNESIQATEFEVENIFPQGAEALLSGIEYRGDDIESTGIPFLGRMEDIDSIYLDEECIVPEESLSRAEEKLSLEQTQVKDSRHQARERALLDKARKKFEKQLKDWHRLLIDPIKRYLPASPEQTVTFIPEGLMTMLPFAIFKQEEGRYFFEDHPSLVAPSIMTVSLLAELHKQRGSRGVSGESVVVGNPASHSETGLQRLPFAESEGLEVGALLGVPSDHLLLGEEAILSRILPLMKRAQWIHCACHGSYLKKENSHSVYDGLLHFTPDEEHQEGKLFAEDISKMDLEAELVFLSACYSGQGNTKYIHEGLVGLTRAFASGGVLTSASSYWKLPDSAETVQMIKTFYSHVLGKDPTKRGKAIALREAMLEALRESRENEEDPQKWGSIFLTGLN